MADEFPKDYSTLDYEDTFKPPVPPMRRTISPHCNNTINPSHHANNSINRGYQRPYITLDGAKSIKPTNESGLDLKLVVEKLQHLAQENRNAYAIDTLNKHYTSVFTSRRKSEHNDKQVFKAYIHYENEQDTYVIRVNRNTLKAVRDKLPKRGNYRYFFKQLDNTHEEVESDESTVPYHEKAESKHIYCQVFPQGSHS